MALSLCRGITISGMDELCYESFDQCEKLCEGGSYVSGYVT